MIDDNPPWLPCERCSWARCDCTCAPLDEAVWEGQLRDSESHRERLLSRIGRDTRRAIWEAA